MLTLPVLVFADPATGNEPWSAAFLEANPDGKDGYIIKNLTNKDWQSGLNIWWRATVPCGTFSGSGLSASWDRAGCDTIDYAKTPASIAVIIQNTKVSGKEYPYPDHLGVPAKNPPEHLIVYAEYPEEGRKHGYGTSLLYYGYDIFLKYNSAREGTVNANPLPNLWGATGVVKQQEGQVPEKNLVSTEPEQVLAKSGGVPWVPIAFGVAVLGGAAYWIRSRMIGGEYGRSPDRLLVDDLQQTSGGTKEKHILDGPESIFDLIARLSHQFLYGGTESEKRDEEEEEEIGQEDLFHPLAPIERGKARDEAEKKEAKRNRCIVEFDALEKTREVLQKLDKEYEALIKTLKDSSILGSSDVNSVYDQGTEKAKQAANDIGKLRRARKKASEEWAKASDEYEKCMRDSEQWVGYKGKLGDKASADYAKPGDTPEEPEVM